MSGFQHIVICALMQAGSKDNTFFVPLAPIADV